MQTCSKLDIFVREYRLWFAQIKELLCDNFLLKCTMVYNDWNSRLVHFGANSNHML